MELSTEERRRIFKLLNVSEAAEAIGMPRQKMYDEIRVGRMIRPDIRIGKRLYYHADDLPKVVELYAGTKKSTRGEATGGLPSHCALKEGF